MNVTTGEDRNAAVTTWVTFPGLCKTRVIGSCCNYSFLSLGLKKRRREGILKGVGSAKCLLNPLSNENTCNTIPGHTVCRSIPLDVPNSNNSSQGDIEDNNPLFIFLLTFTSIALLLCTLKTWIPFFLPTEAVCHAQYRYPQCNGYLQWLKYS